MPCPWATTDRMEQYILCVCTYVGSECLHMKNLRLPMVQQKMVSA